MTSLSATPQTHKGERLPLEASKQYNRTSYAFLVAFRRSDTRHQPTPAAARRRLAGFLHVNKLSTVHGPHSLGHRIRLTSSGSGQVEWYIGERSTYTVQHIHLSSLIPTYKIQASWAEIWLGDILRHRHPRKSTTPCQQRLRIPACKRRTENHCQDIMERRMTILLARLTVTLPSVSNRSTHKSKGT